MNREILWQLTKSDYARLIPVLGLAFYIGFIPHRGYPYPVHMDEWISLTFSRAIQAAGSVNFSDPFTGVGTRSLGSNLEAGYHLIWAVFQQISGLSWLTVFRYFSGVVLMMTSLSAYTLGRRQGFGWQAAFFVCLLPTTIGVLGPAFMVPVAMGLLFIPLSLFAVFNFKSIAAYFVLFLFTSFLLAIHAPSAIILGLILGPYILLNIRGNARHSLGITAALLVPFLAPFPWIFRLLAPTFRSLFKPQIPSANVSIPQIIETYGYIPILLCLLGAFLLAMKGGKKNYGLLLGLLVLLFMLVSFYTFGYGVPIVYERGLMYMMLMVSIIAGAGMAEINKLALPWKINLLNLQNITQYLGKALCLVLLVVILAIAIPDRLETPYYHIIDDREYTDFVWIEKNIGKEYDKAILDPWKATAFAALTGKAIFTRLHASPQPSDIAARQFLESGCVDTEFLKKNEISIVYTNRECQNPGLTKVRENVYLLKR